MDTVDGLGLRNTETNKGNERRRAGVRALLSSLGFVCAWVQVRVVLLTTCV